MHTSLRQIRSVRTARTARSVRADSGSSGLLRTTSDHFSAVPPPICEVCRRDFGAFGQNGQQRAATDHYGPLLGGSPTYLRGLPTRLRTARGRSGSSGLLRTTTDHFSAVPPPTCEVCRRDFGAFLLRTTARRTPETSWQQGSDSFTGVGEVVGVGVVGVVGGCEHTALSASAFGIHSATYNSCNSVAGKRQAKR